MSDTQLLQAVLDKVSKLDQKVDKGFKNVELIKDISNNYRILRGSI